MQYQIELKLSQFEDRLSFLEDIGELTSEEKEEYLEIGREFLEAKLKRHIEFSRFWGDEGRDYYHHDTFRGHQRGLGHRQGPSW